MNTYEIAQYKREAFFLQNEGYSFDYDQSFHAVSLNNVKIAFRATQYESSWENITKDMKLQDSWVSAIIVAREDYFSKNDLDYLQYLAKVNYADV